MYILLRSCAVACMSISDGEPQKTKSICQGVGQKLKKKKKTRPTRVATIKKMEITSVGEDVEKLERNPYMLLTGM